MTEKRFTLKHFESTDWAYDNGTYIDTKIMVELLNALHEENKQLKCDLKTLQLQDEDRKAYQRTLEKENKSLKASILSLENELREIAKITKKWE